MTESIWRLENPDVCGRTGALDKDIQAEALVIGAGLAGVLTAHLLAESGVDVVVIDARGRSGGGVTGNTTAKVTAQHNLIYNKLITDLGLEGAQQYAQANIRAIEQYERIIAQHDIECDFEEKDAYVYALDRPDEVEKEAAAAKRLGIDARFVTQTRLPFPVAGAVCFGDQRQLDPLKLIDRLCRGLTIYTNTSAVRIEKDNRVITDGGSVSARHIIVATHYPLLKWRGFYFMRLYQQRSYVLALEGAADLGGMYIAAAQGGLSFRNYRQYLLLGGGGHRTGESHKGGGYGALEQAAAAHFQEAREYCRWSAQDCMSLDGVPYIGYYGKNHAGQYVATGFNKWGFTSAMAAAMLITKAVCCGGEMDFGVFSPQRMARGASLGHLIQNGRTSAANLFKAVFSWPHMSLEQIEPGQAGIIRYRGAKVGVYRDEGGDCHIVSALCPHMGCQLSWNAHERSWDCPCHGSRFDYKGNLLDTPAQRGI